MPEYRELTPDELQSLANQGLDPEEYKGKKFTVASDDEVAQMQKTSAPEQPTETTKPSYSRTIADTLKAHAGGIGGGGLGGIAAAEAFPLSHIAPPYSEIAAGAIGGIAGSFLGQKAQEKILGDKQKMLEQQAQESAQENPKTALATDIIASSFAGGGKPNISNIGKALSGEGRAIAKIAGSAILNPAINTGINYALTGEAPSGKDLLAQSIGGAFFSEPAQWASRFHKNPQTGETQTEPTATTQKEESVPASQEVPASPYKMTDEQGNPIINDSLIKDAYKKTVNPKPDYKGMSDTDAYIARSKYDNANKLSIQEMRDALHNKFVTDNLNKPIVALPSDVKPTVEQPVENKPIAVTAQQTDTPKETAPAVTKEEPYIPSKEEQEETLREAGMRNAPPSDEQNDLQKQYNDKLNEVKELMKNGDVTSDEFKKKWQELEDIKNKNKGNVPNKNTPDIDFKNQPSNDNQALAEHIKNGKATVESALNIIAQNKQSPFKDLANHFLDYANREKLNDKIKYDPAITGKGSNRSHYSGQDKLISLSNEHTFDEQTVMHEIGHALTLHNLPEEFEGLRGTALKNAMDNYISKPRDKNVSELIQSYYQAAKELGMYDDLFTDKNTTRDRYIDTQSWSKYFDVKSQTEHPQFNFNTKSEVSEFKRWLRENNITHTGEHDGGKDNYSVRISKDDFNTLQQKGIIDTTKRIRIKDKVPTIKKGVAGDADSSQKHFGIEKPGYQMGDLHEFATAILQDKEFQNKLNDIPSGKNDSESLWSRIVNAIRNILGIDVKQKSLLERALKATDEIIQTEREHQSNKTVSGDEHYAPVKREEDEHIGFIGNTTRAALDKLRDINHPDAGKVADAFQKVFQERQNRIGVTWNKIKETMDKVGFTKKDGEQLQKISEYENLNGKAAPSSMFTSKAQREVYKIERQVYDESGKYRIANNEPVYRNGVPTKLKQDPFAHPTTPNPKIVELYKNNTDKAEIKKMDDLFVKNALKYGKTTIEAEDLLKQFKQGIQGNLRNEGSNMQFYNAARRAQGIPLPKEFTRSDYAQNLEAYYHRQATDNTFYKNVESNPEVMSALGEKKDAWGGLLPQNKDGVIANNPAVRSVLQEFHGEVGGLNFHNEKSISSLLTTLFISNPALETHKMLSNVVGALSYADNPYQMVRQLGHMVKNFGEGIQHAKENGTLKMTARSVFDVVNNNSTFAEKLQAISKGIQKISSLNDLTNKFSTGLLQAGMEYTIPEKIQRANNGDRTAQQLLRKINPDFELGKQYSPEEISKMASSLAGFIHGTHDSRTLPTWMTNDSEFSGFFKLANWSTSQTNRFMQDIYTPLVKNGDYKPLIASLFGSAIGGYIIKELREKIQGKDGQIPSLKEIANSDKGIQGNKGLVAYNLMAASQYAGFAGLLSQVAKYPLDFIYKNNPQGATFPMDEVATDLAKTIGQVTTAIANDPHVDWGLLASHVANHVLTSNIQLSRIAFNQAINHGLITGEQADKKMLSDKLGQLRRFNIVEGLPYDEQSEASNPYTDLEQKQFKHTQNIGEAVKELPNLISNIVSKYGNNPDVMMEKLKGLKQNSYPTMPNPDTTPLSFFKYMEYVKRMEGEDAAQNLLKDYMQHKVINEAKSSMVP